MFKWFKLFSLILCILGGCIAASRAESLATFSGTSTRLDGVVIPAPPAGTSFDDDNLVLPGALTVTGVMTTQQDIVAAGLRTTGSVSAVTVTTDTAVVNTDLTVKGEIHGGLISLGTPLTIYTAFAAQVPGVGSWGIGFATNGYRTCKWQTPYQVGATGVMIFTRWVCWTGDPTRIYSITPAGLSNIAAYSYAYVNPTNGWPRRFNGWGILDVTNIAAMPPNNDVWISIDVNNWGPNNAPSGYTNYLINSPAVRLLYP